MLLGLGLPEWLVIAGLAGGLWLTFRVMARGAVAYEKARASRREAEHASSTRDTGDKE